MEWNEWMNALQIPVHTIYNASCTFNMMSTFYIGLLWIHGLFIKNKIEEKGEEREEDREKYEESSQCQQYYISTGLKIDIWTYVYIYCSYFDVNIFWNVYCNPTYNFEIQRNNINSIINITTA